MKSAHGQNNCVIVNKTKNSLKPLALKLSLKKSPKKSLKMSAYN